MNTTKMIALAGLMFATVAACSAADEINWTGYYLGINSGYSFGQSDARYLTPAFSSYAVKSKPEGGTVGLQVGGNYEFKNHLVVGLERKFPMPMSPARFTTP